MCNSVTSSFQLLKCRWVLDLCLLLESGTHRCDYASLCPPCFPTSFKKRIAQLLFWGDFNFWSSQVTNVCLFFFLQVFLVQVNPGETFTIRAEDGTLQCIQGKRMHKHMDEHCFASWNTCCVLSPKTWFAALRMHWSPGEWELADVAALCILGAQYLRMSHAFLGSPGGFFSSVIYLSVPSCSLLASFLWHPLHLSSGGVGGSCLEFHPHGNDELIAVWDRCYRSFPEHHPGLFGLDEQ